jgi:hypothetical protein
MPRDTIRKNIYFVLAVHHTGECTRLGLINQLSAGYIPTFLQVFILLLHSGSSLHIDRRIDQLTVSRLGALQRYTRYAGCARVILIHMGHEIPQVNTFSKLIATRSLSCLLSRSLSCLDAQSLARLFVQLLAQLLAQSTAMRSLRCSLSRSHSCLVTRSLLT